MAVVEDEGMDMASAAALELTRLKEVAHYKILAKDATDVFEIEPMKFAAEAAQKAQKAEAAAAESLKTAEESASSFKQPIEHGASTDAAENI